MCTTSSQTQTQYRCRVIQTPTLVATVAYLIYVCQPGLAACASHLARFGYRVSVNRLAYCLNVSVLLLSDLIVRYWVLALTGLRCLCKQFRDGS